MLGLSKDADCNDAQEPTFFGCHDEPTYKIKDIVWAASQQSGSRIGLNDYALATIVL